MAEERERSGGKTDYVWGRHDKHRNMINSTQPHPGAPPSPPLPYRHPLIQPREPSLLLCELCSATSATSFRSARFPGARRLLERLGPPRIIRFHLGLFSTTPFSFSVPSGLSRSRPTVEACSTVDTPSKLAEPGGQRRLF